MNTKRNVYLDMKSIEEAKKILFEQFENCETQIETLDVVNAKNRVLARPAIAAISSPNFHAAAMDGIALDAKISFGASEDSPNTLVPDKHLNTHTSQQNNICDCILFQAFNIIIDFKKPICTNHGFNQS